MIGFCREHFDHHFGTCPVTVKAPSIRDVDVDADMDFGRMVECHLGYLFASQSVSHSQSVSDRERR